MKKLKYIILIFSSFLLIEGNSQCQNMGFQSGDFSNWDVSAQNHPENTCNDPHFWVGNGVVYPNDNTRTTVHVDANPVFDVMTCNTLERTPPGRTTAAQIGNVAVGGKVDSVSYTVTVTPQNNFLIYEYSCVLEEPSPPNSGFPPHAQEVRPTFLIDITDANGDLIGPAACSQIVEWANDADIGLRRCNVVSPNNGNQTFVYYRPWTTIGVDLRPFQNLAPPNNQVTISFKSMDCGLCRHFGYGYIHAQCDSLGIEVEYCESDNFATLTAPPGFAYNWQNGQTTREIVLSNPNQGDTVWVDLITIGGCSSRLTTVLNTSRAVAQFTSSNQECLGTPIQFQSTSYANYVSTGDSIPITSTIWNFGDGDTSHQPNPSHTYTLPNTYIVTLNVESEAGCVSFVQQNVSIMDKPVANFVTTEVCFGDSTSFTDLSSISIGNIVSWNWDFGDPTSGANTSNLRHPKHMFTSSGTYQVSLEVTSDQGCVDDTTMTVTINDVPVANFQVANFCKNQVTNFTDVSIGNTTVVDWTWNFGDGAAANGVQNPTHTYNNAGIYQINLTVENEFGCIHTINRDISINEVLVDFNSDSLCAEDMFTFLASSSTTLTNYSWDFGDGNTSNIASPQHVYPNVGFYDVKLVGTSVDGCLDSTIRQVQVYELPTADFIGIDNIGCDTLCAQFTNTSYIPWGIGSLTWDFGDGAVSNDTNPLHCYTNLGTYDVTLAVSSIHGCRDTLTKVSYMTVTSPPVADFEVTPTKVELFDSRIYLVNTSQGENAILWDIDTFSVSNKTDFYYLFPSNEIRTYPICLTAFVTAQCQDSICKEVETVGHKVYTPNSFTPNGDGVNDEFFPNLIGVDEDFYKFYVFNRWGDLIFQTDKVAEGWDGMHKDKLAKQDVYVWKVVTRTISNQERITQIGHVTLLRKKTGK